MAKKADTGTVKLNVADAAPVKQAVAEVAKTKARIVGEEEGVQKGGAVKKPAFLDNAVRRSGVKRRDAKPAIEAALNELAEALLRGDEINLPPLGKIKVTKNKPLTEGAHALTLKLRTMKDGAGTGNSGVADDGEDG